MALKLTDLRLFPVDKPDSNKLKDAYEVAADIGTIHNGIKLAVPRASSTTVPVFRPSVGVSSARRSRRA